MSMYTIDKMLVRTSVEIACVHPGITDTNLYRNHLPEGNEGCKRGVYSAFGKMTIFSLFEHKMSYSRCPQKQYFD